MGKAMKKKKSLPEELIEEILVKLPVNSLLRFRCVCKSWFDLIKSTNFINMHLKHQRSTKNGCILVIRGVEDGTTNLLSFHSYESLSSDISSPHWRIPHFNRIGIKVYGPCNGLLCLSDCKTIALCNPATREFKVVPPRPFPCPEEWICYGMAIGFGFDSNTNDYKILALVHLQSHANYIIRAEIYNLSTNSWREIHHDCNLTYLCHTPVYGAPFNGALHWIARSEGIGNILSFKMSTEVFREMELPDDPLVKRGKRKYLTILNESLALFAYTSPYSNLEQFVDIWVMQKYGVAKSWTKQVSIGPVTGIQRPLLLWKNEAILLESTDGRLVSCALDTREINDFDIHGVRGTTGLMVYNESLISIE